MPIYAYRCASCGHAQDVLQKLSDAPLNVCPACGADAFQKQITAAGFQLKGSGWYATDFRGGNSGGSAAASKPADAAPSDGGSGKADGGGTKADGGPSASSGGCGTSCACH